MLAVDAVINEIDRLRTELVGILRTYADDEGTREERIKLWAKRAHQKLAEWGFPAAAEKIGGRNSSIQVYEGVNRRAKMRDDILLALRDELHDHPEDYQGKLSSTPPSAIAAARPKTTQSQKVFLGHGNNPLWAKVQLHLSEDLHLGVEAWESDPRAGRHSLDVLNGLLVSATFAVIVATGEDLTAAGEVRARQNVVHEIGLFQGRLGFQKVALLEQSGIEGFSNLAGLQVIRFSGHHIEAAYYELDRVLRREGILASK